MMSEKSAVSALNAFRARGGCKKGMATYSVERDYTDEELYGMPEGLERAAEIIAHLMPTLAAQAREAEPRIAAFKNVLLTLVGHDSIRMSTCYRLSAEPAGYFMSKAEWWLRS